MSDLQLIRVPTKVIGYGRMGVFIDAEIRKRGIDVSNEIDGDPAGTVLHCSTPAHLLRYREGQRLTILTMWESTHLPEAMHESLHLFETVFVPSMQNVELFGRHHPNVRYVPLGVDINDWQPTRRKAPEQRFTFLIGGSGPRKGLDLAYKAFRLAFPDNSWGDGPEPWLTLKSPNPSPFGGERVTQINGRLSAEDEIALYADAHCYLQPSRGEGFGLQPLQAIAQGLPTILTHAHGHAAFADLGIPISASYTPTIPGSFMFGEAGDWWEPNLDELTDQMRWVYDNYAKASERAWTNAHVAVKQFTWENTAKILLNELGPLKPYTGSGEWMTPDIKLYRAILVKHHGADIAGTSYRWEPFTEYWVPADVKRVLFDGGYLDPSCVFGDSGLTKEQVESSGLKSGAESHCGTCGQRLGSQPTRADLLYAEMEAAL
jgi:glycosyltransferase involved in cell wall biosynthesis